MTPRRELRLLAGLSFLFFSSASFADQRSDEIGQKLFKDVKAEALGAAKEDVCGGWGMIQGSIIHFDGNGREAKQELINKTPHESFGCHGAPGETRSITRPKNQTFPEGDGTVQYFINAMYEAHQHTKDDTKLEGIVRDAQGKPVKGVVVKAREKNRGRSYESQQQTGPDGRYEIMLRSGLYDVWAEKKKNKCSSQPVLKIICAYGKVLEHNPKKQDAFTQDVTLDCPEFNLRVEGPFTATVTFHEFTAQAGGGYIQGEIPLEVDYGTGKITGQGVLQEGGSQTSGGGAGYTAAGSIGSATINARVTGSLADGTAQLYYDPSEFTAASVQATITSPEGESVSRSASRQAGANYGPGNPSEIGFSLPWQLGATHHHEHTDPYSFSGGHGQRHEVLDFTLVEKTENQSGGGGGGDGSGAYYSGHPGGSGGSGSSGDTGTAMSPLSGGSSGGTAAPSGNTASGGVGSVGHDGRTVAYVEVIEEEMPPMEAPETPQMQEMQMPFGEEGGGFFGGGGDILGMVSQFAGSSDILSAGDFDAGDMDSGDYEE